MEFKRRRDWSQSTISKAHDTRDIARRFGAHGNAGTLTFSFSREIGDKFLARFCNGHDHARVKLELVGSEILISPAIATEHGRKFSVSSYKMDYRAFFDGGNYPWIKAIKPFGATPTPTRLTDKGILMVMPTEKDRNRIEPYSQYRPRGRPASPVNLPAPQLALPMTEVMPPASGTLYLVMVPRETDEQFHILLRFLKLEALRE